MDPSCHLMNVCCFYQLVQTCFFQIHWDSWIYLIQNAEHQRWKQTHMEFILGAGNLERSLPMNQVRNRFFSDRLNCSGCRSFLNLCISHEFRSSLLFCLSAWIVIGNQRRVSCFVDKKEKCAMWHYLIMFCCFSDQLNAHAFQFYSIVKAICILVSLTILT